jgi:DNA-binding HxlR family transcriptional regulator|uniref:winged helix-turn-helix transcriptional regulator n=1 Tax=Prevotella sp. TaxID=59823 RepID=UPI002672A05C|nr:helix-turn-helix domain-containing protein [uncultured Prevotella sp.]
MRKLDYDYCHAAPILEWMSRKWALVTLLRIEEMSSNENESVRFGDLFRSIPHISEKMLASTLDYLVQEGLLVRRSFDSVPPRVEYSLTAIAISFLREISYVIEWGQLLFDEIMASRNNANTILG